MFKGVLEVIMPENYIAMFRAPDKETESALIKDAVAVLEKGSEIIKNDEQMEDSKISIVDRIKSGPVNPMFYKLFVHAKGFYATELCVKCGKCAELCPLGNIRVDKTVEWGSECTHCMACICKCPFEAIEYGARTVGKRRYHCSEFHLSN